MDEKKQQQSLGEFIYHKLAEVGPKDARMALAQAENLMNEYYSRRKEELTKDIESLQANWDAFRGNDEPSPNRF